MRTEDELAGALRVAAERAPDEGDLLAGVATLRRRRTRRRIRMLAAATAVVVLGMGVRSVVLPGGGEVEVATTPSPTAALGMNAVPVDRLWPTAVLTVPATNADGMRYQPITGISATEVLLLAASVEEGTRIELYDAATKRARVVAEVPMKPTDVPPTVTADGENVAWMSYGRKNGVSVRRIWTAPLSGGKARLVTTISGPRADIDSLAINGDRIFWSERRGDVWGVPLSGGASERIPAGRGLRLLRWPWASDAPAGPDDSVRSQSKIVDLASGYTIEVVAPPGTRGLRCGPFWCLGHDETGSFLQRIDGSSMRRLDDRGSWGRLAMAPVFNRFAVSDDGIYDIATGRVAATEGRWTALSAGQPTIVYWEGGRDTLRVLNLAAVPSAQ
ncbi:TolB family protein [Nonomuraea sp. 3N208]|uniref:TolB family protein n=1 Tax=Nonomuraea sp. 3N208 TaxID=3457421 RepID=UPI003FD0757C